MYMCIRVCVCVGLHFITSIAFRLHNSTTQFKLQNNRVTKYQKNIPKKCAHNLLKFTVTPRFNSQTIVSVLFLVQVVSIIEPGRHSLSLLTKILTPFASDVSFVSVLAANDNTAITRALHKYTTL